MPGANQQPRILTPEEVEVILESVDGVDSLVATLRFHERRAIQTRQLADDYKRLVESAHEDTDAARRWSRVWKEGWRADREESERVIATLLECTESLIGRRKAAEAEAERYKAVVELGRIWRDAEDRAVWIANEDEHVCWVEAYRVRDEAHDAFRAALAALQEAKP